MKIEATQIARTFSRQTSAYAEYQIFSSIAPFSDVVRNARISLTRGAEGHSVGCSVLVILESGRRIRVTARGRHAYDAINRAARKTGGILRRHPHVAPSDQGAGIQR
jgi:hypothetical protein